MKTNPETNTPENPMLNAFAGFKGRYPDAEEIKPLLWNLFKAAVTAEDLSTDQRLDLATTYEDLCKLFDKLYPAYEQERVAVNLYQNMVDLAAVVCNEKELTDLNEPTRQNLSKRMNSPLDDLLDELIPDESTIK